MRRLLTLPQEPLPRFRLLSVSFASALAFLNSGLFAFDASLPAALRLEETAAAALLGAWWLYGYRRGGFPIAGWFVDASLVFVVAGLSPMPADGIALFFGGLQLRALFVPRRQLSLLIVSYGIARVGSAALTHSFGHVAFVSPSPASFLSVVGLAIIAVSLHLFVDATERNSATTRELARSDERYRLVARATRDVVYDWHVPSGRIEWTESMQSVFGYRPDQVGNLEWWLERVHPADLDLLQRSVADVVSDPARSVGGTLHYRVRRADGRYAYASSSMIVQRTAAGAAERVVGSIRDVTSEHLLEERLRQAQKMEVVGQLAGGVAHDFNNLLTVIGGHVYMLEENLGERDAAVTKHLSGIGRAADRAAALTKQLLAFGRKQLLSPKLLDVNALVDEVLQMMRPALGERITVVTRLEPNLKLVHADAGQLSQVLVNLALNARDAISAQSDGRGTLAIETANAVVRDWDDPRSGDATPTLGAGEYVKLTVCDTGIGMGPQTLARAFEPFFTTKPHGQGTGLGLATVYGIVKQSFGDVQVESAPGSGSTFTIHLPIAAVDRQSSVAPTRSNVQLLGAAVARTVTTQSRQHRGVLLVEDDNGVREFAAAVLSDAGYDVCTARDGVDALERMREHGDSIDIVVTDVVMPEMGGRELVERLRARGRELPVLYVTGYNDEARMLEELTAHGARLLEKPFTAAALVEAASELGGPAGVRVARAS